MYVPAHAREERIAILHDAIRGIAFGTLVTVREGRPMLSHLPMKLVERGATGTIIGHVSRANTQWHEATGTEAAVTFVGASFYVSPSDYPSKAETGKVVPTYDYIAVEGRGTIEFFHDRERLLRLVDELTNHFEASQDKPWSVSDAPPDYIDNQLRGIVGFEVPLDSLVGAWKLSFNRAEDDREGVARAAEANESAAVRELADTIRSGRGTASLC